MNPKQALKDALLGEADDESMKEDPLNGGGGKKRPPISEKNSFIRMEQPR